jgi:hypothetical protein
MSPLIILSRDSSLLLRESRVYIWRLATGNVFTLALRSNVRGAESTAFFYFCVIAVFTEALPMNSLSKSVTIPSELAHDNPGYFHSINVMQIYSQCNKTIVRWRLKAKIDVYC